MLVIGCDIRILVDRVVTGPDETYDRSMSRPVEIELEGAFLV